MYKNGNLRIETNIKNIAGNAEILIYGDISDESWWGDEITPKQVNDEIDKISNVSQLDVRIQSYGGSVFAGVAIASMIDRKKKTGCHITVYIDGIAASMASVIAMVGDEIIMPSNAYMMVHKPSSIAWGNADNFRKEADLLDKIETSLIDFYMRHFIGTREELSAMLSNETWLTGTECFEKGLCTKVEDAVDIAATAKGYTIKDLEISKNDISDKFKEILNKNINTKGGENEQMHMNEEIQKQIIDLLECENSCVLTLNQETKSIDLSKVEIAKPQNSEIENVYNEFKQLDLSIEEIKVLVTDIKTVKANYDAVKAENEQIKQQAEEYKVIRNKAIENAIEKGKGVTSAKNVKLDTQTEFDEKRYAKIFENFTLDEINAQSKEWDDEKKLLLNAGQKTSFVDPMVQNTIDSKKQNKTEDYKI